MIVTFRPMNFTGWALKQARKNHTAAIARKPERILLILIMTTIQRIRLGDLAARLGCQPILNFVTTHPISSNLERETASLKGSAMEVQFEPAVQAKLEQIARESGLDAVQLVQDAVAGYVDELAGTREMLDSRYDDIKSGKVKMIPGDEAFARLRARIDERRNG